MKTIFAAGELSLEVKAHSVWEHSSELPQSNAALEVHSHECTEESDLLLYNDRADVIYPFFEASK